MAGPSSRHAPESRRQERRWPGLRAGDCRACWDCYHDGMDPPLRALRSLADGNRVAVEPYEAPALLDKRETRIRRMFGNIAPSYDLLNHLLSLNIDRYWRWRTTRLVPPIGAAPILDLCTGTGDLALAYDHAASNRVPIVGADFCHEMMVRAAEQT